MGSLSSLFSTVSGKVLDFLLPRPPVVRWLENADSSAFSRRALRARGNIQGITSLFDYKDPLVRTLVWQVKFKGKRALTELAARLMHEHLLAELADRALFEGVEKPLLVPVPLAPKRLAERGFNQCDRIAEEVRNLDGGTNFTVLHAVVRIKETPSQTKSRGRAERFKNLQGAFKVSRPEEIKDRHVIVLDDVATTGATIGEIRTVLLAAGAKSVSGLTFAH